MVLALRHPQCCGARSGRPKVRCSDEVDREPFVSPVLLSQDLVEQNEVCGQPPDVGALRIIGAVG